MKTTFYFSFLWVCILSVFSAAAHLELDRSQLWTQVGGYAYNPSESDPNDDPGTPGREQNWAGGFDPWVVDANSTSAISTAQGTSQGHSDAAITPDGTRLRLNFAMDASGATTTADSELFAYAGGAGVDPGVTDGIFYTVVSDGEPAGAPVLVHIAWQTRMEMDGDGYAHLDGGVVLRDLLVSINSGDSGGEPPADTIIYRYPGYEYDEPGTYDLNDAYTFVAAVGDVIGLYVGNHAHVWIDNEIGFGQASIRTTFDLQLEGRRHPADLNHDRKVNLADLAVMAESWLWEAPKPTNQTCAAALKVLAGKVYEESTVETENGELWYQFVPARTAFYTVSLCESNFNTNLTINADTGGGCPGEYFASDADGCGEQSRLEAMFEAERTYYLCVSGQAEDRGTMRLQITQIPIPDNDEQDYAIEMTAGQLYQGTTTGSLDGWVWYRFTPEISGYYTIRTCGSALDTNVTVYDHNLTEIAFAEEGCGTSNQAEVPVELVGGRSYYVTVWHDWKRGNFQIQITGGAAAPANDECVNAVSFTGLYADIPGTTVGATGTDVSSCGLADEHDVWFLYTAQETTSFIFSVNAVYQFQGVISVFDKSGCPGTELGCADRAAVTVSLTEGQQVLVRVSALPEWSGPFTLNAAD